MAPRKYKPKVGDAVECIYNRNVGSYYCEGVIEKIIPAGSVATAKDVMKYYQVSVGDKLYATIRKARPSVDRIMLAVGDGNYTVVPNHPRYWKIKLSRNLPSAVNPIKYLRKRKGLTQIELSKLIKVNQSTVSRLEDDRLTPDASLIGELIEVSILKPYQVMTLLQYYRKQKEAKKIKDRFTEAYPMLGEYLNQKVEK